MYRYASIIAALSLISFPSAATELTRKAVTYSTDQVARNPNDIPSCVEIEMTWDQPPETLNDGDTIIIELSSQMTTKPHETCTSNLEFITSDEEIFGAVTPKLDDIGNPVLDQNNQPVMVPVRETGIVVGLQPDGKYIAAASKTIILEPSKIDEHVGSGMSAADYVFYIKFGNSSVKYRYGPVR